MCTNLKGGGRWGSLHNLMPNSGRADARENYGTNKIKLIYI